MTLSLRRRILLTLAPVLVLVTVLGGAGITLLNRIDRRIDAIPREPYDPVSIQAATREARATVTTAVTSFAVALASTVLLAAGLAWWTSRSILRPIQEVTRSALAIGAGNLNQTVPVVGRDELGQLAAAFNQMTDQLRDYRESHSARLLRAQRTSQATIDAFPDPVLVVDLDGRVERANPAARQVLGIVPEGPAPSAISWQPPELLRRPLENALRRQQPFLPEAFDQAVTFRIHGEEHAFLPQVLPIRDPYGATLGAAVLLHDVTRFRLLDQLKSDLVATVSHELKTPLTSVRLAIHLLLEETVGPLAPKQTELLLDARDNAERLLKMIEHLLSLARLEHGQESLALQPESPATLLQTAADAVRPRAESKHVELVVEDTSLLPNVAADRMRLGYALNNLLDNALTYTEQGGRIALSARAVDNDRVQITVADTGLGIPPEYLPHVFDKFFRVPETSKGQGTGLGLAIVREIVIAHDGDITCDSAPGRGTTFSLTLPVAK